MRRTILHKCRRPCRGRSCAWRPEAPFAASGGSFLAHLQNSGSSASHLGSTPKATSSAQIGSGTPNEARRQARVGKKDGVHFHRRVHAAADDGLARPVMRRSHVIHGGEIVPLLKRRPRTGRWSLALQKSDRGPGARQSLRLDIGRQCVQSRWRTLRMAGGRQYPCGAVMRVAAIQPVFDIP
jgi:hypothetical protein